MECAVSRSVSEAEIEEVASEIAMRRLDGDRVPSLFMGWHGGLLPDKRAVRDLAMGVLGVHRLLRDVSWVDGETGKVKRERRKVRTTGMVQPPEFADGEAQNAPADRERDPAREAAAREMIDSVRAFRAAQADPAERAAGRYMSGEGTRSECAAWEGVTPDELDGARKRLARSLREMWKGFDPTAA